MGDPIKVNVFSKVFGSKPAAAHNNPAKAFDPTDIGLYGFKSPKDFEAFLRTSNGKVTMAIIADVIKEQLMEKQQQELEYQRLLYRRIVMISLMLLGLAYRKHAHAKLINAAYDRIKRIKELDANSQKQAKEQYKEVVDAYQEGLNTLQKSMRQTEEEATNVENELNALAKDQEHMERQHNAFDEALKDVFETPVEALQQEMETIDAELTDIMEEIQTLLENDKEDEAREKLALHNAKIARRAAAQETLDLKDKEPKFKYYDKNGSPVNEAKAHAYVVPNEMELVRDPNTDEFLLLKAGTLTKENSFDSLPESVKESAKKEFTRREPELRSVHSTITEKKKVETKAFEERCKPVMERSEQLQEKIIQQKNLQLGMQAALAEVQNLQNSPAPKSQPSIGSANSANTANKDTTSTYRHLLQLMQLKPTSEQVHRLEDQIKSDRGADLTPQEKRELQEIKPGQRILPGQMEKIMNLLANTGATVTSKQHEVRSAVTPMDMNRLTSPFSRGR